MQSRAVDALEWKRRLADWWLTERGHRYANAWYEYVRDEYTTLIGMIDEVQDELRRKMEKYERLTTIDPAAAAVELLEIQHARESYEHLHGLAKLHSSGVDLDGGDWEAQQSRALRLATAYWVSEPMTDLVNAAYDSMPEQSLRREDLPADHGFALICPRARLSLRWEPVNRVADPFSHAEDERPAGFTACSWTTIPQAGKAGVRLTWWTEQGEVPGELGDLWGKIGSQLAPYSVHWVFGEPNPAHVVSSEQAHRCRWVQAFWTLLNRPLVARERGELPRAARRRAQRANEKDPHVTVITLRSPKKTGETQHRTVDWKHRWLVRGFWRQQWYPSMGEHRAIWIDDFIKGPEDRPLRIKEHVYAWKR